MKQDIDILLRMEGGWCKIMKIAIGALRGRPDTYEMI